MLKILGQYFKDILKPIGLVFGDIGTSPIYTLSFIFISIDITEHNVIGVLSLIIWTLIIISIMQYAWLTMSLSKRGEGGEIVLFEILAPLLGNDKKRKRIYSILTYIGISLLIGDGVITPSVSILSSVEGLGLVMPYIPHIVIILLAILVTVFLFSIQKRGSDKVSIAFGPIMFIWFILLGVLGVIYIFDYPSVFLALNPYYGIVFLFERGFSGIFILSSVILCTTGVEAIYADMGHLGRRPILKALSFVFIVLVIQYMGQCAFLLTVKNAKTILFNMVLNLTEFFYIPFLILSLFATVIASQAMISGVFSVVYQGIMTKIFPILKVKYTSAKVMSQIYINVVNKFLMFFVIIAIIAFNSSTALASVYGVAVTGTITISAIIIFTIFILKKLYVKAAFTVFALIVDLLFLIANSEKIPNGGYWSLIIAIIPFSLIMIFSFGQKTLHRSLQKTTLDTFAKKFKSYYENNVKLPGTALFCISTVKSVHPYIIKTMFKNNIIYEDNVLVNISKSNEPYGVDVTYQTITDGLKLFKVTAGYMEYIDLDYLLKLENIDEKVVFYGIEDIETTHKIWKIFSVIKKLTPSFVEFYKFPIEKLHGVTNRTNI